ncbi:hypothetical protein [Paraglaciecola hydrolytica]|uniref:Uncharacterized protein n=1 Tax=Paraglaciecola hydrolytica TaxID=1799789 RepID=A0A136A4Y3_9ALTE|nr:hypothetical protein [Paraglaciecola hydrolytica]KXI30274.1 hypothetical protein AX660_09840 [Paraglaciecola hydrolytica]
MQIDGASSQIFTAANTAVQSGQRPPPPNGGPPPGGPPPGLESAVSTLSEDEQDSVSATLESLSKEQQDELKSILNELKSSASSMSDEELGKSFLSALKSVSGNSSQSNSQNIIDVFA